MANHILLQEVNGWYCFACSKRIPYPWPVAPAGCEDVTPRIILLGEDSPKWEITKDGRTYTFYLYPPDEKCPVHDAYQLAISSLKPFPQFITSQASWDQANDAVMHNLTVLLELDKVMPEGMEGTERRFRALKGLEG
jgi:hypothetical protein